MNEITDMILFECWEELFYVRFTISLSSRRMIEFMNQYGLAGCCGFKPSLSSLPGKSIILSTTGDLNLLPETERRAGLACLSLSSLPKHLNLLRIKSIARDRIGPAVTKSIALICHNALLSCVNQAIQERRAYNRQYTPTTLTAATPRHIHLTHVVLSLMIPSDVRIYPSRQSYHIYSHSVNRL